MEVKKDLPAIIAAHGIPYVATATPAHPVDLMNKVRKAASVEGPAFIHIFSPCPTGWRMPTRLAVAVARLAVETRVYPLYEVINGEYRHGRGKKPKPVSEYLNIQVRFKHLEEAPAAPIQAGADRGDADLERRAAPRSHQPLQRRRCD